MKRTSLNSSLPLSRRKLLNSAVMVGAGVATTLAMPSYSRAGSRPSFTHGVQSGDVSASSGVIWGRVDRPANIVVEVSTRESFESAVRLAPSLASPSADYSMKRLLTNLPSGQDIFYRMSAHDVGDVNAVSEPIVGRFRTAPTDRKSIRFAWSGDTAGQGWGIDVDRGGMATYATMAKHEPDFFIHSGDTIYADGPIAPEQEMPDGGIWKNQVVEGVEKVAETLDEFRGRWKYNLTDEHVRHFNAQLPTFFQWDDHEVVNNWSSAKDLSADDRYTEKNVGVLSSRAGQAFHEMTPIGYTPEEPGRVYRKISYGPMLDVFFLDLRSYRGPNTIGDQTEINDESVILGAEQMKWLKQSLASSKATWKVIACDMPIGLLVWDRVGEQKFNEAVSNGLDTEPRGRELEFASLFRFIKAADIDNVVFFTADVHYTAAHYYDPNKAKFQDFKPFWEFVSGPLHAGSFGPNGLDMTFGPEVKYAKAPSEEQGVNLPPSMGLQFFGLVDIDGDTQQMSVRLMDRGDDELYKVVLDPVLSA